MKRTPEEAQEESAPAMTRIADLIEKELSVFPVAEIKILGKDE